ncbi:MAG: hypothetical protein C4521_07720 [Actinobacteria bacterium]|nr:MAG: hypothetical protein C4521_07720 [Actinomycetota bacterium]
MFDDRFYKITLPGGTVVEGPSVTTLLSVIRLPGVEWWRGELGNEEAERVLNEAGELGSDMHKLLARYNRGEKVRAPRDPQLNKMFRAHKEWSEAWVRQVIEVEYEVRSVKYQYGGTVDLVALLKGERKPAIIDYKTGRVYRTHHFQTAGYLRAYEEQTGIKAGRRIVIHLDKHDPGTLTPIDGTDPEDDQAFLCAMFLWRKLRGGKLNVQAA